MDSLVGCFAVGLVPSGSSDPFALRRAAMGIVKILVETKLPVSLSLMIAKSARTLESSARKIPVSPEVEKQVLEFLLDRARFVLKERGRPGLRRNQRGVCGRGGRPRRRGTAHRSRQGHPQNEEFRAAGRVLQAHPQDTGQGRPGGGLEASGGAPGPVYGGRRAAACTSERRKWQKRRTAIRGRAATGKRCRRLRGCARRWIDSLKK